MQSQSVGDEAYAFEVRRKKYLKMITCKQKPTKLSPQGATRLSFSQ